MKRGPTQPARDADRDAVERDYRTGRWTNRELRTGTIQPACLWELVR